MFTLYWDLYEHLCITSLDSLHIHLLFHPDCSFLYFRVPFFFIVFSVRGGGEKERRGGGRRRRVCHFFVQSCRPPTAGRLIYCQRESYLLHVMLMPLLFLSSAFSPCNIPLSYQSYVYTYLINLLLQNLSNQIWNICASLLFYFIIVLPKDLVSIINLC